MGCKPSKARAPPAPADARQEVASSPNSLQDNLAPTLRVAALEEQYEVLGQLGKGAYGEVKRGKQLRTGRVVAIKCIRKNCVKELDGLRNEISLLRRVKHPNVVPLFEVLESASHLYFTMQLCSGGNLLDMLNARPDPLPEMDVAHIIARLMSALSYLHHAGICHRDVKLDNLVFDHDRAGREVMLCDLGTGHLRSREGEHMHRAFGSIFYLAPEMIELDYTERCDVWSAGVCAYMLLSKQPPFLATGANPADVEGCMLAGVGVGAGAGAGAGAGMETGGEADGRAARGSLGGRPKAASIWSGILEWEARAPLRKAAQLVMAFMLEPALVRERRAVFQAIDTAQNGVITREELRQAIAEKVADAGGAGGTPLPAPPLPAPTTTTTTTGESGPGLGAPSPPPPSRARRSSSVSLAALSGDEQEALFRSLDMDGTGRVNYLEFLAATVPSAVLQDRAMLRLAFDRLDADGSGFISKTNLREMMGSDYTAAEVDRMIESADIKRTGHVDFDEFLELMSDPQKDGSAAVVPAEQPEAAAAQEA
eukprot:g4670.t1